MCVYAVVQHKGRKCAKNHQENEGSYSLNHTYFHVNWLHTGCILPFVLAIFKQFFCPYASDRCFGLFCCKIFFYYKFKEDLKLKNSPLVLYGQKYESLKLHLKQRFFFVFMLPLTAGLWSETGCDLIVFEALPLLLCREGCWVRQTWWPIVLMVLCSSHTHWKKLFCGEVNIAESTFTK